MRDRVAISAENLAKINKTNYKLVRKNSIESFKKRTDLPAWIYASFKKSAYESAEDRKAYRIKKHFSYHAGHCVECEAPLIDFVYPLDTEVKNKRGLFITKFYACKTHSQKIPNKIYTVKRCCVCGVYFSSMGISNYCSNACRSYDGYQKRKPEAHAKKCVVCDAEFIPKRVDAVYCGGKCRTANHRAVKVS